MVVWNWKREAASPEDILDAAKTIPSAGIRLVMDLSAKWIPARRYYDWACAALQRGGEDGWDTASSLAKRAVCRRMDGILAHNHLSCFLGRNNEKKAELLAELRVPALTLLRDLVIDPRNDIEHAYEPATQKQSRHACEAADLFLTSTDVEAEKPVVIALGWTASIGMPDRERDGKKESYLKVELTKGNAPTLLITGYPADPKVDILLPQEETIRTCGLKAFNGKQALELNSRLRECLRAESFTQWNLSPEGVGRLSECLNLS